MNGGLAFNLTVPHYRPTQWPHAELSQRYPHRNRTPSRAPTQ